ncbi:hypothetical protein PIS_068 [Saccharomonospora phage PIS 136]|nr:hypothetical protein PIS_068 [Saccharomonospora phage PIS 136]
MTATITFTTDFLDQVCGLLNLDSDNIRTDYSGRGMAGDTCLGIVVDDYTNATQVGAALMMLVLAEKQDNDDFDALYDGDDLLEVLGRTRTDSMGLDQIVYWPDITVADND